MQAQHHLLGETLLPPSSLVGALTRGTPRHLRILPSLAFLSVVLTG